MNRIEAAYRKLFDYFGDRKWWTTTTCNKQAEIVIGAILTQNIFISCFL